MESKTIYCIKSEFKKITDYLYGDIFYPRDSVKNIIDALDDIGLEISRLKTRNVLLSIEISKLKEQKEETFVSEKEETFVSEDLFEMAENTPIVVEEQKSFFARWMKKIEN